MVNTQKNTRNNKAVPKNKVRGAANILQKDSGAGQKKTYKIQKNIVKVPQAIKVGSFYNVKITALSSANLGLNEFTFGFPILIGGLQQANATLGDFVQIKVLKIQKAGAATVRSLTSLGKQTLKSNKLAIAKIVKVVTKNSLNNQVNKTALFTLGPVEVTILKKGPKGSYLSELPGNFKLIVATQTQSLAIGQKVTVKVTRIKKNYAFAMLTAAPANAIDIAVNNGLVKKSKQEKTPDSKYVSASELQGSKFSFILNKKVKRYLKHIVITMQPEDKNMPYQLAELNGGGSGLTNKLQQSWIYNASSSVAAGMSSDASYLQRSWQKVPTILFIKPIGEAKQSLRFGDKVKIQIIKAFKAKSAAQPGKVAQTVGQNGSSFEPNDWSKSTGKLSNMVPNILIGKIIDINPIASMQSKNKKVLVQNTIKQMLNSGMHFGEKAVKCNARMKNYILTARSTNVSTLTAIKNKTVNNKKVPFIYNSSAEQKNKPLIQKGRNVINLLKTRRCLNKALTQLTKYAAKGKTFLFVGTKKAAAGLIARASLFSKKAFFVNTRWLGGMLTNWKTILKSISKIRPILKEKQVIIKDILQKRQSIKSILMEKAFLLKKKSQVVLKKGRQLFQKLQNLNSGVSFESGSAVQNVLASQLISKRKEFVQKGQILFEKRQFLLQKRKQLLSQSTALYQKALVLINNSKAYFAKATLLRQKVRELKALLFVSQYLQTLQQTAKANNNAFYTISYNQYKQLNQNFEYIIPNPPKEILNQIILLITAGSEKNNILPTSSSVSNISQKDSTSGLQKVVILTKLLSQFSSLAPSIKLSIKGLLTSLQKIQTKLVSFQETFKGIVAKMQDFINIKANIVTQLLQIQQRLTSQRNIIRIVKRKFKQILAQKRFIQFLPKLRYLPTPSTKIAQTVQVLMKKIVDPKLKYPIDSIYDPKLLTQSKKVAAMRKKKWQRLEKYLGGISNMTQIAGGRNTQQISNNVAIIIGQQEEINAVRECKKLGIKMFHIVDTNCNPSLADHFIPANDDSRNSIQFILTQFLTRIRLSQKLRKTVAKVKKY
uniref:Small ribosomal subunit protein uS2c n=1 Tax=Chlamydomonas peterfii TaxID=28462 RepID=A0A0S2IC59_9CHLO|nr:ribosomal protein S2 [Chlamydomonas peterfii]